MNGLAQKKTVRATDYLKGSLLEKKHTSEESETTENTDDISMGSLPATASDEVLPLSDLTFPLPNDPVLYVKHIRSPEFIRKMLSAGPCQLGLNCPYDFPKTDGRSFRRQWYYVKMKNGMIRYRDWLVYSPEKDSAFCFPCWQFANRKFSL